MSHLWTGEGPIRRRRSDRAQVALVIVILLLLEFYLRPSLVEGKGMPDFLLLSLLLLAIRNSPGTAALIGFIVGLVMDVLTPARFGANILAHVLIGYGAALGRAVVFADHLVVNAGLFFIGAWVRNILVLLLSGTSLARLGAEALMWAPLQGLSTALVGVAVVILFRDWLAIRIE
ncbi:MAG TPA: rod shape-determining protein MreD [Gemmatimonadales bacterium]|nr:rod shape-determining protein MreD [Gemmatimonadales bacterium]